MRVSILNIAKNDHRSANPFFFVFTVVFIVFTLKKYLVKLKVTSFYRCNFDLI